MAGTDPVPSEPGVTAAVQADQPALSIMELEGLGKDLWRGIDAASHVEAERAAWD